MPEDQTQPDHPARQTHDRQTHDLAARIGPWVDAALERYGAGERFAFQMTVQVLPPMTANQPPSFKPVIVLWLPGPLLGTVMSGVFTIDNPVGIEHTDIDSAIQQACTEILTARSQALSQVGNGQGQGPGADLHLAP